MKLLSLYAYNFKKLRFESPLEFPEGVVLISGPNESGKSSILDAILYALFGRVIRPQAAKKNDIIAYGAGRAAVELNFSIEDRRFKVRRELFKKRASKANLDEVMADGGLRPLATGFQSVTEEVEKLLGGITFNEIVSSTVVAQKDLAHLIEQRKDDRRKVINVFLNLESFNKVLSELDEERKELGGTGVARPGRVNVEKDKLEELRRQLSEYREREKELNSIIGDVEGSRVKLNELKKKFEALDSLYKSLTEYGKVESEKKELMKEIEGKEGLIKSQREQVTKLKVALQSIQESLQSYSDLDQAEALLRDVRSRLNELKEIETKIDGVEGELRSIENEVKDLRVKLPKVSQSEIESMRKGSRSLLPALIPGVSTIVLGFALLFLDIFLLPWLLIFVGAALLTISVRRLSRFMQLARMEMILGEVSYLETREGELEKVRERYSELLSRRKVLKKAVEEGCSKVERYRSILLEKKEVEVKDLAESILKALDRDLGERNELIAKMDALNKQLLEAPSEEELNRLEKEAVDLKVQLNKLRYPTLPKGTLFSRELLDEKSREREELLSEISRLDEGIRKDVERIEKIKEYLEKNKDLDKVVARQKKFVDELERRLRVVRKALQGIEKTAEALRNRVKPGVERYMGIILPDITAGRYKAVRLDDDYNLEVWDPEAGEFRERDAFSGGTEDQILLAMRLAFALALLPEVKGIRPEFLFLDEPLGSSDEIRRTGIMDHITTKLRGQFRQIFLISHIGGLQEYVENVIEIEDGSVIQRIEEAPIRTTFKL